MTDKEREENETTEILISGEESMKTPAVTELDSKIKTLILEQKTAEGIISVMNENLPEFFINEQGQYVFNHLSFYKKLIDLYESSQSKAKEGNSTGEKIRPPRPFYLPVNETLLINELLFPDFLHGRINKNNLLTYLNDLSHTSYHGLVKAIYSLSGIYNDCCEKTFPTNFVVGTLMAVMKTENTLKSYISDARFLGYKLGQIPLDLISFITRTPQGEYRPPENMPYLKVDHLAFLHFSDKLYKLCKQCHLLYRLVVETGQYWVTWPNDGVRICYTQATKKIRIQCWKVPVYLTEITLNDVHSRRTYVPAGDHEYNLFPSTTHLYVSCKNDRHCICRSIQEPSNSEDVEVFIPSEIADKNLSFSSDEDDTASSFVVEFL